MDIATPPPFPNPGPPSWWQLMAGGGSYPPLDRDVECDVCIVGAGISGTSTAFHLASTGGRIVLLDSRRVAGGASGRNGGFLLAGLALRYRQLCARFGARRGAELYRLTAHARDELFATARELGLAAHARRTGSLRLAIDEAETADLEQEARLLREHGLDAQLLERHELPELLQSRFLRGISFFGDGASEPASWVRGLAASAADRGVNIFEHSPATRVESPTTSGAQVLVHTAAGHAVRCTTAVIATEAYIPALLPELAGRITPYRSQVVAARPAGNEEVVPCPMWARRGWDYVQQTRQGVIVLGGEEREQDELYHTYDEAPDPGDQRYLERWLGQVLGIEPIVLCRWSGVLSRSSDSMPFVGRVRGRTGVVVCGGWGGAGNVLGFAGGSMVASLLSSSDTIPPEFRADRDLS